jgi:hypothetical protein
MAGDKPDPFHSPWRPWLAEALRQGVHADVRVPLHAVPPPRSVGFRRSLGALRGQRADHRHPVGDGRGLHVRTYRDRYEVHWDHVHPHRNPVGHWLRDSPSAFVSSLAGAGLVAVLIVRGRR